MAQQRVGAGQREAVVEDREPAQRPALVLGEQVPRPVDDRHQGLVPVGRAAVAAAQQREPVVEPPVDVLDRHHPHLGRGQLDGQGQPVEPAYDAAYGVVVERDARAGRRGALAEQVGGGLLAELAQREDPLGRDRERRAGGGHDAEPAAGGDQVGDQVGDRRDDVLAVVEDQERRRLVEDLRDPGADVVALLGGEHPAAADRVADAERGADLADDVLGRGDADQLDEVHHGLVGPAAEQVRQPGLAEPARAEDRGDPRLADRGTQRPDVLVAADQRRGLEAQPLAHRPVGGQQLAVQRPGGPAPGRRRAGRRGRRGAARRPRAPPARRARRRSSAAGPPPWPRRRRARRRAAGAPRRGRRAPTGPGRARRSRSRGAGPRLAGARRAARPPRCPARAGRAPPAPGRGPGPGRGDPRPRGRRPRRRGAPARPPLPERSPSR